MSLWHNQMNGQRRLCGADGPYIIMEILHARLLQQKSLHIVQLYMGRTASKARLIDSMNSRQVPHKITSTIRKLTMIYPEFSL